MLRAAFKSAEAPFGECLENKSFVMKVFRINIHAASYNCEFFNVLQLLVE